MRYLLSLALFVSVAICTVSAAQAERRVALVIGNSAYQHTASLENPKHDAKAVSAALERLDFEVLTGLDADIHEMIALVRDFSRVLEGADVALFFYAGHGLQVDGVNYLAPVDAELGDQADLDFGTVKLSSILRQMDRHRSANLVFLDACRDNPLARSLARSITSVGRSASFGRGLARVEAGIGTLIAYATQPGNIALDGTRGHSPFTEALLNHIETPGLDIGSMLIKVRQDVIAATGEKQIPWDHSSLTGQFYFKPGTGDTSDKVAVVTTTETPESITRSAAEHTSKVAEARLAAEKNAMELAFWNTIKDSNDPDLLQTYLNRFPDGVYADLAQVLIERARRQRAPTSSETARLDTADTADPPQTSAQREDTLPPPPDEATRDEDAENPASDEPSLTDEQADDEDVSQPADAEERAADDDEDPGREDARDENAQDDPEDAGRSDAMVADLRRKALDGDRDAATDVARYYDRSGNAKRAAGYALIALEKGGEEQVEPYVSDTKAWSKDFWASLQVHLQAEGMYRGGIDGVPGPGTKAALQRYAGIKVEVVATPAPPPARVNKTPQHRTAPPPGPKHKGPPTRGKPPPNRWCLIDPNWSRCTNQ